jgi:hypothetical protein
MAQTLTKAITAITVLSTDYVAALKLISWEGEP